MLQLPAGRFLCSAAVSWLCVDHSQSHGGTPPLHYGWGNTWSQPLQPGSWAEVLAVKETSVVCVCFGHNSAQSGCENVFILSKLFHCTWLPGITPPQKAVSTKHFPVASRSFSWKLPRVVVGGMLFLLKEKQKSLLPNVILKYNFFKMLLSFAWTHQLPFCSSKSRETSFVLTFMSAFGSSWTNHNNIYINIFFKMFSACLVLNISLSNSLLTRS